MTPTQIQELSQQLAEILATSPDKTYCQRGVNEIRKILAEQLPAILSRYSEPGGNQEIRRGVYESTATPRRVNEQRISEIINRQAYWESRATTAEEKLRKAGERVGIQFGCDTADWMAEEIEGLRAKLQTIERDTILKCAKAICYSCGRGETPTLEGQLYVHLRMRTMHSSESYPCTASSLWALLEPQQASKAREPISEDDGA